jgi:hypothetical protein
MDYIKHNYENKINLNTHSWFDNEYHRDLKFKKKVIEYDKTEKTVIRCKKVEIYPNDEQRQILLEWFHIYINVYNFALYCVKNNNAQITSKTKFRNNIKKLFNEDLIEKIKKSKIPVHTVDNAIFDLHKAYKSNFSKKKNFRMRYKKHNIKKKCLLLESSCFSKIKNAICPRVLGEEMKSQTEIKGISNDVRMIHQNGKFSLYIPTKIKVKEIKKCYKVGIDPGFSTFMTCYSPNGGYFKIGNGCGTEIKKLCKLTEKKDEMFDNNKKKKAKYNERIYTKIKNKVDDLQWKTINYLCTHFSTIKIGKLSTIDIVRKSA